MIWTSAFKMVATDTKMTVIDTEYFDKIEISELVDPTATLLVGI
jgi:hypothetical protein